MILHKVMLIDDEVELHETIRELLEDGGYDYCGVMAAEKAIEAIERHRPDLLLLDVMMPRINGFKLCEEIRACGIRLPIIMLTAKSDIVDKSIGFQAGADDYVTKPFDAEELLLRIGAHIRRSKEDVAFTRSLNREGSAAIGDLEVRFEGYEVLLRGEVVPLTTKEFEVLALLAATPGRVFTREQIYEHIWGEKGHGRSLSNVTVFVRRIREKIEENPSDPRYLLTVQRIGYKMAEAL